jgi:hypothetical protein
MSRWRWWDACCSVTAATGLGGLALVNAALGWLDLAFAQQLGLPPHVNFLLIVVWLVMLGISTLQRGALAEGSYRPLFTAQSVSR